MVAWPASGNGRGEDSAGGSLPARAGEPPLPCLALAQVLQVEELCRQSIPVRLCKGAYHEHSDVAFTKKQAVDANYLRLMIRLLDAGTNPAIASHDEAILRRATEYARERRLAPQRFEFQMLYGIRRDLQRRLVADGYRLRLYVPYGNAWYPYFMRRLAERPANVLFLVRNLLRT